MKNPIEGKTMEERQRWIPCSERLPIIENNNRARVLITTSWGFVKEAYYCVDHWEINDIDFILTSVIAWMPLPEPYKEGEHNETYRCRCNDEPLERMGHKRQDRKSVI